MKTQNDRCRHTNPFSQHSCICFNVRKAHWNRFSSCGPWTELCVKVFLSSALVVEVEWKSALILQYSEIHCLFLAAGPEPPQMHPEWKWSHNLEMLCGGFFIQIKEHPAQINRNTYNAENAVTCIITHLLALIWRPEILPLNLWNCLFRDVLRPSLCCYCYVLGTNKPIHLDRSDRTGEERRLTPFMCTAGLFTNRGDVTLIGASRAGRRS